MSNKIQNLFDIKHTQIELVRDRGYIIPPEEQAILGGTLEQFENYLQAIRRTTPGYSDRARLARSYTNEDSSKILVVAYIARTDEATQIQIPSEVIANIVNEAIKHRFTELLIIVGVKLSPRGNEILNTLTGTRWQIFYDSDLTYNPTLSVDVPRHELLSAEVAAAKLIEWKVDISKLLIYESSDPIVKYYGWPPGSIVRVTRKDDSVHTLSTESINYRVVNK